LLVRNVDFLPCIVANAAAYGFRVRELSLAPRNDERRVFVIARSEATKQSSALLGALLDCFAALAMTRRDRAN